MINIVTEKLPDSWHWSPQNPPPSGTVELYMATAECLAGMGYSPIVYYDGVSCELNDVVYLPRAYYKPSEINIHCNTKAELGAKNIYWTSLVTDKAKDFMEYDHRITLSKYHKSIFGDSTIIGLGIYPELYELGEKGNFCLYSSSPDRGGEFIDEKAINNCGYKLIKTYKKDISEVEMIELYKQARFWLHPCQGVELFCLSAVKAQASGCIPVFVPNQALETTVKYGVKTTIKNFNKDLIKALKNPPKAEDYIAPTWLDVTKEIVNLF